MNKQICARLSSKVDLSAGTGRWKNLKVVYRSPNALFLKSSPRLIILKDKYFSISK